MTGTATSLRLVSAAVTDKGLSDKRPVNEDSYLEMATRGLFAVADGVGGAQAGDFASQTAMEILYEAFTHAKPNVDSEDLMLMAINRANEAIHHMSTELVQLSTMATTIVALQLKDNVATIGHVGDSRIYRLDEKGELFRETEDHSIVEDEVRAGRMTPEQAMNHPSRNVINRALGAEKTVEVDMKTIMFTPGSWFVLCSDGITRHVTDAELRAVLRRLLTPEEVCAELKRLCFERGAEDNLTAVVVRVEPDASLTNKFDDERTIATVRSNAVSPSASAGIEPASVSGFDGVTTLDGHEPPPREVDDEATVIPGRSRTVPLEAEFVKREPPREVNPIEIVSPPPLLAPAIENAATIETPVVSEPSAVVVPPLVAATSTASAVGDSVNGANTAPPTIASTVETATSINAAVSTTETALPIQTAAARDLPLAGVVPAAAAEVPPVVVDAPSVIVADVAASESALQLKIDNERLRAKVDNAAPPIVAKTAKPKSGNLSRTLLYLVLVVVGAALALGGIYAWNAYQQRQQQQQQTQPSAPSAPEPTAVVLPPPVTNSSETALAQTT